MHTHHYRNQDVGGVGGGTKLLPRHGMLLHKKLHWFHHMQSTELTDHHVTAYPDNRKLCNCVSNCATAYPTNRQQKDFKGIVHLNIIFSYMKVNKICNLDHPVY